MGLLPTSPPLEACSRPPWRGLRLPCLSRCKVKGGLLRIHLEREKSLFINFRKGKLLQKILRHVRHFRKEVDRSWSLDMEAAGLGEGRRYIWKAPCRWCNDVSIAGGSSPPPEAAPSSRAQTPAFQALQAPVCAQVAASSDLGSPTRPHVPGHRALTVKCRVSLSSCNMVGETLRLEGMEALS